MPEIPAAADPPSVVPVSEVVPESLQPASVSARAAETAALAMRRFFTVVLLEVRCVRWTAVTLGRHTEWLGEGR